MRSGLAAAAILLSVGVSASAHRLDEYLQATMLLVGKDSIEAQIRLAPGVAVLPVVLAQIDADGDGLFSAAEQQAYAARVLRDLSFVVDGNRLTPRLLAAQFPLIQEMREGLGEIRLDFVADLPRSGRARKLVFGNRHQGPIAAYLVNCLVPRDPDIRITAQNRNYRQSFYELDYVQSGAGLNPLSGAWWSGGQGLLSATALILLARLALLWRRQRLLRLPG